jgi:hypothetical protein
MYILTKQRESNNNIKMQRARQDVRKPLKNVNLNINPFIHPAVCTMTGLQLLPKQIFHRVWSGASPFNKIRKQEK